MERGAKSRDSALPMALNRGRLSGFATGGDIKNDGDGVGLARASMYDGRERGVRRVADEKETRVELLPVVPGVKPVLRVLVLLRGVGVREPWKLFLRLTPAILLAGELPGVSSRLLPSDRSLDMTVETESRS